MRSLVTTLVPPLTQINTLGEDLIMGERAQVIQLDHVAVSPLVCFDSIYERNALESVRSGAQLLAVPTNDSWFKDSRGVWMHHAQAQLRAIETGRPIMRAANTGVSSIITHKGEVKEQLGPFLTGYVIHDVQTQTHTTLYTIIGNLFAWVCLAFAGGCVLLPITEKLLSMRKRR